MSASHTFRMIVVAAMICASASAQPNSSDTADAPSPAERLAAARRAYSQAQPGQDHLRRASELLSMLLAHGRERADQSDWQRAGAAYREAFEVAAAISPADAECVLTYLRSLNRRREAMTVIQEARDQLQARPSDADLRRRLMDLTIIHTGDFAAAAELADDMDDDAIGRLAALAAGDPSGVVGDNCLALARWHKGLADQADGPVRIMLLRRSGYYCQRFLQTSGSGDPETESAVELLTDVYAHIRDVDESADSFPTDMWIDLLGEMPLEPVSNSAPWRRTDTGLIPDAAAWTCGRFPIVIDGEYELQLRFAGLGDGEPIRAYLPAGAFIGCVSVGGYSDYLTETTVQPSIFRDADVHTLIVKLTGAALTADVDGLPYMIAGPPMSDFAASLDNSQSAEARGHIMLSAEPSRAELISVCFKLASGRAWRQAPGFTAARTRSIRVLADQPWQWVTQLNPGDVVEITSTGQWSPGGQATVGPAGDEGGWYALRGRLLNSGQTFTIGDGTLIVASEADVLKMEMDDVNKADNHGAVDVTVRIISDLGPVAGSIEGALSIHIGPRNAQQDLEMLYGQRIRQVGATFDTDDDIALAKRMLRAARAVEHQPLAVLLADSARQLAMDSIDGRPAAINAIKLLLEIDPDGHERHRSTLIMLCRKRYTEAYPAIKSAAAVALFNALITAADRHVDAGRWDMAYPLYRQAQAIEDDAVAAYAGHLAVRTEHAAQRDAIFRRRTELNEQLAETPTDVDVRSQLILLNVAEFADSQAAAELANDDIDADTREALQLAGRGASELMPSEALSLADWYRRLAQQEDTTDEAKYSLLDRAWRCCQAVLSVCRPDTDFARAAGELAEEIDRMVVGLDLPGAGPMRRSEWINLLRHVDLPGGVVREGWRRRGKTVTYAAFRPDRGPGPLAVAVLPHGEYDIRLDLTRLNGSAPLAVCCPLVDPTDGETWWVLAPVIAADAAPAGRQSLSVEIRVRRVEGQAVIDVVTNGSEQFHRTLAPREPWGPGPAPDPETNSLALVGGDSPLIVHSARLRMLSGYARALPADAEQRWAEFRIDARTPWQDSVEVHAGDRVVISAKGAWSTYFGGGPDYICTPDGRGEGDDHWGYLAARVGDGEPFFAGGNCTFTAESDGMLRFQVRDEPTSLADNMGYLTVTVQVFPTDD